VTTLELRQSPTPGIAADALGAARLFEEYSGQIYGYCLRRLGCRSEAEDAVQTTFLQAHRAIRRGVVPESESAWLHTIAKNVCRWQQRTSTRRNRLLSDADPETVASIQQVDGDEEELLLWLKEALALLPERQRQALVLREWQGLTSREVASQLGLSAAETYALLTRARRSLAKALTVVPRRPMLGIDLGSILYQLRSHIKALLGGGAAKAVATTTVVVSVVVGVSADGTVDRGHSARPVPVSGFSSDSIDPASGGAAILDGARDARQSDSANATATRVAPSADTAAATGEGTDGLARGPVGATTQESSVTGEPGSGDQGRTIEETIPLILPPEANLLEEVLPPELGLPLDLPLEPPAELPLDPSLDPDLALPADLLPAPGTDSIEPPAAPDLSLPDVLP